VSVKMILEAVGVARRSAQAEWLRDGNQRNMGVHCR
jgi:hypothetical protein